MMLRRRRLYPLVERIQEAAVGWRGRESRCFSAECETYGGWPKVKEEDNEGEVE